MPRALLSLPLLLAVARAAEVFVIADTTNDTLTIANNAKQTIAEANNATFANETILNLNDTLVDLNDTITDDIDHDPVVRKKRTFGDIVFRGLADVLGYNVARKPAQTAFPPPLAPVPGIDAPLQAGPAPAPAPAPAPPPCGAPRAAAPPPCRAQAPPPPPPKPTPPPCPKPRAAPRPKPRPKRPPPPPPPPPCARPRANPTTPSPCAPKPPPPPPPPPKADNLETITSNLRLNFNFNRSPANAAPAAQAEEEQVEQEEEQFAPVAIEPRAALLPLEQPRQPRVYVDAFVVRNGVAQKVHAVDAKNLNQQRSSDDDYLAYDDEQPQEEQRDDDYEDVQESRDRAKAVREFGTAVDKFWEQKQKRKQKKLPENDYRNVHFGDRDLVNQFRRQSDESHQSLQQGRARANRLPPSEAEASEPDEESEVTTTTQDPRRRLKPRVLPPTEHNPNQIDTVTVRVPPIYKEKRPKKLHRERPEQPDRDEEDQEHVNEYEESNYDSDSESENSAQVLQTETPKRKRRKKKNRKARSTESEAYTAGDYDYFGKKLPISEEEQSYRALTVPPPTKDADLARLEEETDNRHFLDDHERLQEDPERIREEKKVEKEKSDSSGEADSSGYNDDYKYKADEKERSDEDKERASENERSDERERTDKLSPNARVRESGYQNNYVRATNVQVDDPDPFVASVKKKKTKIVKA